LYTSGHFAESIVQSEAVLHWRRTHPTMPVAMRIDMSVEVYGKALVFGGRADDAVAAFEEELAMARQLVPVNEDAMSSALFWLAHAERRGGHYAAAAKTLDELEAFITAHKDSSADQADVDTERVRLAIDEGTRPPDCEIARKAVAFRAKASRNNKAIADATLAACLVATGRRDEAATLIAALQTLHADSRLPPLTRESVDAAWALWQKGT
jgi:hypothetical protein